MTLAWMLTWQQFILTGWHFFFFFCLKRRSKVNQNPPSGEKPVSLYFKLFLANVFMLCGARRLASYCRLSHPMAERLKFLTSELFLLQQSYIMVIENCCLSRGTSFTHTRQTHVRAGTVRFSAADAQVHDRLPQKRVFSWLQWSFCWMQRAYQTFPGAKEKRKGWVCVCVRARAHTQRLCLHAGLWVAKEHKQQVFQVIKGN